MTEKCLIQESLRALEMNEDSWQDYVLIIEETNSRARSSQHLRDNDKLYLNKRISIDLSSCNFKKKNSFDWESSIQDKNLLSIQENSCIDQSEEHCEETNVSDILEELSDKEFQDYFSNKEVEDQSYTEETKDNSSNEIAPQVKTDLKEIRFQSYLDRSELKEELGNWCKKQKMGLTFKTQERELIDGSRVSTLYCDKKYKTKCNFMLEFRTDPKTKRYKLASFQDFHNHQLNVYDSSKMFNNFVIEKIKSYMNHTKNYKELCNLVNKECELIFFGRPSITKLKSLKKN